MNTDQDFMASFSPRAIRIIFALTVCTLPLNLLLTKFDEEPFPALTQPAFGGSPARDGMFTRLRPEVTVVFSDLSKRVVPINALLPASGQDQTTRWKKLFYTQAKADDPATVRWISSVLASAFVGQSPTEMNVVWRETRYPVDRLSEPVSRVLSTVSVKVNTVSVAVNND